MGTNQLPICMLEKVKVPNIVQIKKVTNQDKTESLPWGDLMGNGFCLPYQRKNKTKDQPTTPAGKEDTITTSAGKGDDTDSTAIKTTATFTSRCELEWNELT